MKEEVIRFHNIPIPYIRLKIRLKPSYRLVSTGPSMLWASTRRAESNPYEQAGQNTASGHMKQKGTNQLHCKLITAEPNT